MKKLLIVLLCFSLTGCGLARMASIQSTRNNLSKLNLNMTTEQVKQVMGNPYTTETFLSSDNKTVLVWNYDIGQVSDPYGITHKTELIPLIFKDNLLIGWGVNYYEKIVSPDAEKATLKLNIKNEN